MCLDGRTSLFHKVRLKLDSLASPLQHTVSFPFQIYNWGKESLVSRQHLVADNQTMRIRLVLLDAKLEKLLAIENENKQLRAMLSSSAKVNERVSLAQLLAISLDDNRQVMVLRKGLSDGVYVGQPVVDAHGVFGQIIDVNDHLSKVMLVTDKASRIPVVDSRSGIRSIAEGLGSSQSLALIDVLNQADIKLGDTFVTSGLGLLYPAGYPVATVVSVEPIAHSGFKRVLLHPLGHLDKSNQVLLIWHQQQKMRNNVHALLSDTRDQSQQRGSHAT